MIENKDTAMEQYTTTITQRGQVTLPAKVRRTLGVKPHEKVTFQVEGQEVRLVPSAFTLESAYASVPRLPDQPPIEDLFALAGEEHAAHVRDEMGTGKAP